ncbi:MAG TPA: hypothetical protein VGJ83_04345 [Gemmatimonadales bacterium]|jgi:hypothetical protein
MSMQWWDALVAAGAVPAAFVPPGGPGRTDADEGAEPGADLVEGEAVAVRPVALTPAPPVCFLDGIEQWKVVGYDGAVPIVRAYVAAAVRRRGPDRRLHTAYEAARDFAIAPLAAVAPARRRALEAHCPDVVDIALDEGVQPARVLELARRAVDAARQRLERDLAERCVATLAPGEWLVVDGLLSVSAKLARHPRALGVIKSHGAQFFTGADLERALTVPAAHRTSVFRARGGHARNEVYSWYLRLWPWEGNDLLYGLLRVEACAAAETIAGATGTSGWLLGERAPLATPDARWDRLMYPIHDVETYLRSRAPRDLLSHRASRLPKTGT